MYAQEKEELLMNVRFVNLVFIVWVGNQMNAKNVWVMLFV